MEKKLLIRSDNIPKHVAVIMDGMDVGLKTRV